MTDSDGRMDWKEMLNFARGIKLARPWYILNEHETFSGKWKFEKIFTEFASHESVPGYQFKLELLRFAKENPFARREYGIYLLGNKEVLPIEENETRRSMIYGNVLGSKRNTSRELATFYESLRPLAINRNEEQSAIITIFRELRGEA